jgi:DNA-binding XRE family transcriptional regulator
MRRPDSVPFHGSKPFRLRTGCSNPVRSESVGINAYALAMVQWLTWSGMFNEPCFHCRVLRGVHDEQTMGHGWVPATWKTDSKQTDMARWKTMEREGRGDYDAPLPPPAERCRIRETAGWTQQEIADELHVSRHTIGRFEKKAGLVNGRRMSGREPSREVRVAYSTLLKHLQALPP